MKKFIPYLIILMISLSIGHGFPRPLKATESKNDRDTQQAVPIATVLKGWVTRLATTHPLLTSIQQQIAAQKKRIKPAGTLPDPMLNVAVRNVGSPIPFRSLGSEMMSTAGLVLQQPIPWKGKLKTRRMLAAERVAVLNNDFLRTYWKLRGDLEIQAFELAFLNEQMAILTESRTLLDQLIGISEALYSVGRGTQSDVLRARTERSRLDERIELTRRQLDNTTRLIIERYIGDPQAVLPYIRPVETLPDIPPEAELYRLLESRAPEIAFIRARIRVQEIRSHLKYLDRYPDFALRAGWFSRGSLPDIYEVGIGLNIPIFAGRKQIPEYEAETLDLESLKRLLEDTRFRLRWRIQNALIKARSARRLVDLYRTEILPQARADYEATLTNYQTGRIDFLNVMDRWLRWLNFRIGYYKQVTVYDQALAELESTLGRPFIPGVPEPTIPKTSEPTRTRSTQLLSIKEETP